MILTWKPLSVPPSASPEEAFLQAARVSGVSECVLLGWVKGRGWCGCYAVGSNDESESPAPAIHLMNIGDSSIMAIRRVERVTIEREGDDNDDVT